MGIRQTARSGVAKQLTILGSTGSIGTSTLALVEACPEQFDVQFLVAGSNGHLLGKQALLCRPRIVGIAYAESLPVLREALAGTGIEIGHGEAARAELARIPVDVVVVGTVGLAGLTSVLTAVKAGQTVALAHKESLVSAGKLVMAEASRTGARILPVDSEHSSIFQCWPGWAGHRDALANAAAISDISHICLTASGGPFRDRDLSSFAEITPAQAVRHPNWAMGQKISVDSATMMNKGLEVIEAAWLFDLQAQQIDVMIHPQVVIHGMVYFNDGYVIGQLGTADMKTPISYALAWPELLNWRPGWLDLLSFSSLDFMAVEDARYSCFFHARDALASGGIMPAVLNAANEVAVAAFLALRIIFTGIADIVEHCLQHAPDGDLWSLEAVMDIDNLTRQIDLRKCGMDAAFKANVAATGRGLLSLCQN